MNGMNPFELLLLAHFVGDFLFQTQWMAFGKQKRWFPLIVHCVIYTLVVALASYVFLEHPLSLWGICIIFAGHVFLDRGRFISWWYTRITRCTDPKSWWLKIVYDQVFHFILLYAALQVS